MKILKSNISGQFNATEMLKNHLISAGPIAHDRKCVQYYSVRRALIPFTDCEVQHSTLRM